MILWGFLVSQQAVTRRSDSISGQSMYTTFWIRQPAGVSCRSCLFVVVASVLSLSLSRLFPLAQIFASSNLNPPPPPPPLPLALLCFVFIFPYVVLNSAHASLNTGLVLHISLSFRWLFPYFCRVCHRFAPSLRISDTWPTGFCAEDLLQRISFLYMAFSKTFLTMAFSKTLVYTHILWFKSKQTVVWTKPMFLRQNRLYHKELFHTKTMFLLGLCKSCLRLAG